MDKVVPIVTAADRGDGPTAAASGSRRVNHILLRKHLAMFHLYLANYDRRVESGDRQYEHKASSCSFATQATKQGTKRFFCDSTPHMHHHC